MKCRGTTKRCYKYLIVHLGLVMPRAKSECLSKEKLHLELSTLYKVCSVGSIIWFPCCYGNNLSILS